MITFEEERRWQQAAGDKFGYTSQTQDVVKHALEWRSHISSPSYLSRDRRRAKRECKLYVKSQMQPVGSWVMILLWLALNLPQIVELINWLIDNWLTEYEQTGRW